MIYRHLLKYNARICTGLGPWMIVVPVAATMLVLFALMAMTSLIRESTPVMIVEMLGSILMAFVGVNLLRPEYQYNALETVLTRPVSFRVILTVRVLLGALGVLALQALLAWYMRSVMNKPFDLGPALAAGGASMAFLTALAVAVAAAWRSPTFGFVAAGLYWVLDLAIGPHLNPLFTMRGYSAHLGAPDGGFGVWPWGKLALAVATLLLILLAAAAAARPAAQRSARRYLRTVLGVLGLAIAYVCSGAAYRVHWLESQEATLLNHSRLRYRTALSAYGPLPVAYLFGPAFAHLTGYQAPWRGNTGALSVERNLEAEQLRVAAFGYPGSRWADNALYELGRRVTADAGGEGAGEEDGESRRLGIECLEQLTTNYPASPFAPAGLQRLAEVYEASGRPKDARAAVDSLLERYPASDAAFDAGHALLDRLIDPKAPGGPQFADALGIVEKLLRGAQPADRPELLLQQGVLLSDPAVGRAAEAEQPLRQASEEAQAQILALATGEELDAEGIRLRGLLADVQRKADGRLAALRPAP